MFQCESRSKLWALAYICLHFGKSARFISYQQCLIAVSVDVQTIITLITFETKEESKSDDFEAKSQVIRSVYS